MSKALWAADKHEMSHNLLSAGNTFFLNQYKGCLFNWSVHVKGSLSKPVAPNPS